MKLRNKSEFHEEIFSLSYTDLFFPLFGLISLHRKNLIDIQKNASNLSLVIISQIVFQTLRGPSLCDMRSELLPTTKKDWRTVTTYTLSHIYRLYLTQQASIWSKSMTQTFEAGVPP